MLLLEHASRFLYVLLFFVLDNIEMEIVASTPLTLHLNLHVQCLFNVLDHPFMTSNQYSLCALVSLNSSSLLCFFAIMYCDYNLFYKKSFI